MSRLKFSQKQRRWRARKDVCERSVALDIAYDQFFKDYLWIIRCKSRMLGLAARETRRIRRYGVPADTIAVMPMIKQVLKAMEIGVTQIIRELAFILWFNMLDA